MAERKGGRSWLSWFSDPKPEKPAPVEVGEWSGAPEDRLVEEKELGRGGMASVHRVFDRYLKRHLAMKVLAPELASEPREVRRFLAEAQITAQLEHPCIPAVHEVGRLRGTYFFTMSLLEGLPLDQVLGSPDYAPTNGEHLYRALELFSHACEAMEFAHARGVVHGDLKPGNLLVAPGGHLHVLDWGLARLAGPGQVPPNLEGFAGPSGPVVGSVGYMAPEQARDDAAAIDARTDVFALGAILYCILARQPPYSGQHPDRLLELAREGRITPLASVGAAELPAQVVAIANKALAADPKERFPSAAELLSALRDARSGFGSFPVRRFKTGELLYREGDSPNGVFVLAEGRCQVVKGAGEQREVLRQLAPGAVLGESSTVLSRPRTASIEALGPVSAVLVSRAAVEAELNRVRWMGPIMRSLAHRLRQNDERLSRASASDRQARLALALLLEAMFLEARHSTLEFPYSTLVGRLAARLSTTTLEAGARLGDLDFVSLEPERDRVVLRAPLRR